MVAVVAVVMLPAELAAMVDLEAAAAVLVAVRHLVQVFQSSRVAFSWASRAALAPFFKMVVAVEDTAVAGNHLYRRLVASVSPARF